MSLDADWFVETSIDHQGKFNLAIGDAVIGSPEIASPVDYLLVAVGTCFAKSCAVILAAQNEPENPVSVEVFGRKADTGPNRIDRILVEVTFEDTIKPDRADRILRNAKRICTVSNSLSDAMTFEVKLGNGTTQL